MALNDILGGLNLGIGGAGGLFSLVTMVALAFCGLLVAGGIIWFFNNKKRWNIKKVMFRLPREVQFLQEGQTLNLNEIKGFIDKEVGKGSYDPKRGVVFLKRKGKKKIAMKPFNISEYLDGSGELEVVQIGSDEYVPVIPRSYMIYQDDDGNTCALVNLKADMSESRSWKNSFEREAKSAFSIMALLREYAPIIAIGLVIFLWGIQLLLLYNRLKP